MLEISFDIEDYDLLEAFQEVEGSSSSAPQGIELKELTGDEAPSDEEPSDSEPEEPSEKAKTADAIGKDSSGKEGNHALNVRGVMVHCEAPFAVLTFVAALWLWICPDRRGTVHTTG